MMESIAALVDSEFTVSVIIPVHNGGDSFACCLQALQAVNPPPREILVVADGCQDGSAEFAESLGLRVLRTSKRSGPAVARNLGAQTAQGDLLFFLDADVAVRPDCMTQILQAFRSTSDVAAVMGSYDDKPAAMNFVSQYKNLFHHHTHQEGREEASTFWAGCGVVRRDVYLRLGGFDESYHRPSVEDIELGYRLKAAGHRIRLHKDLWTKHLKRWGVVSLLRCDFLDRALPWTALILKAGRFENDLNVSRGSRLKVVVLYALLLSACVSGWWPAALALAALLGALLFVLDLPLLRFFARKRGLGFALGAGVYHWQYYFLCGLAFLIGLGLHTCRRFRRTAPPTGAQPNPSG